MSVWKKLAGLLFEETETEIVAEDELEPIEIHKKSPSTPVHEETEPVYQMYEPSAPIQETQAARKEEKRFMPIDVEDEPKQKEAPLPKQEAPSRVKPSVREEKKEFEFTPVISPIFGSHEEAPKPKKKPVVVTKPKTKKKNPLGTIISPYYGMEELEEFEQEAHDKIEREQLRKEELPQEEAQKLDVKEEMNSLPLEDLIDHGECEKAQEDLLQISLFGESTPIQQVEEAEKGKEV